MQLQIRFSGASRASFGKHDFEEVFDRALQRFQHRLRQVYVYIEDVNGPRGGLDKQCRCVLHLRRMPPIVISDQGDSVAGLIHRVASRASYVLSQKADRQTTRGIRAGSATRDVAPQPV